MNVQFSDESHTKVVAVFSDPQNAKEHPFQGDIDELDDRYLAFIAPAPVEAVTDPLEKLKSFLAANPDVAAILK